jgi:hypothetical protein
VYNQYNTINPATKQSIQAVDPNLGADQLLMNLLIHFALLLPSTFSYIIKRWPLSETLPVENLMIDGSAVGPNGTSMCTSWNTGTCHDPLSECNQCRSNEPHIFNITWCADTRGFAGISCDLDLGYRSAQGARYGLFQYSIKGRNSKETDYTNTSTVVFPDSPFTFSHFAVESGKNDILTVFQLSMTEGNTDGDDLSLTYTSGFCCRATFSGGKTVTGTIYVGDLTIRANSLAASPSPAANNNVSNNLYSGAVLGGSVFGGIIIGIFITLAINIVLSRGGNIWQSTSYSTSFSTTKGPTPTTSLLSSGTNRYAQMELARK